MAGGRREGSAAVGKSALCAGTRSPIQPTRETSSVYPAPRSYVNLMVLLGRKFTPEHVGRGVAQPG